MDTSETTLAGKTICAIGRFAAMSQKEFRETAAGCGCQHVAVPNPQTDFVVLGDAGYSESAKALLKAWELRHSGVPLQIISESDFYRISGQIAESSAFLSRLTITDLAAIVKVPPATVRQWVRWGLIEPMEVIHRLEIFGFRALAAAKRLRVLTEHDVPMARIRRELKKLRDRKPDEPLSEADLVHQHGRLLVRRKGHLIDGSGQTYFDFSERSSDSETLEIPPAAENLEDVFEKALRAESTGHLSQAIELYRQAIRLSPSNPVLHFNLGNTFYAQGRLLESRASFQTALALDDGYAEAWNNLGNVHLELEQWKDAIEAFGQSLKLVADYREANQNLGLALALLEERRQTKVYRNRTD
jgi:tetratricopeptide (TPR) repeat protein